MNKQNIKFETLHKKINIKNIVIGILVIILIVLVIVNRFSHANFTSSLNVPLVNGKINYKHPDFKIIAMFQKTSDGYTEINTMPNGNDYVINENKSYCNKGFTEEKDDKIILKTVNGNHIMNNLTKNDRCFLYFDENFNVSKILAKYTKDNSRSGQITAGFKESKPTTVYSKEDDYGDSYVFAGVNPNNWVKIENFYFRIIRFNGNGSMRLIYSGSGSAETSGTGTQIGQKEFNINEDDNMYVGLKYTSGQVHGTDKNSTILNELYDWYNYSIKNTYESIIDSTVGFCNDRDNYIDYDDESPIGGGTGTTETYYGGFIRFYKSRISRSEFIPNLKCKNSTDLLKLPIGLITADEYALAGGGPENANTAFWLYTGENYWTMTPYYYLDYASMFLVSSSSILSGDMVSSYYCGIRPVINLKSTTTFSSGTGTSSDPYVVKS